MDKYSIGILMLNTSFPRLPGDIGNAESFRYPTLYRTVEAALPSNIVTGAPLPAELVEAFAAQAIELQASGAGIISTSCGFLSVIQANLTERLEVPVITSSLVLLPWLRAVYGGNGNIGILTFDADALNERHFTADACPDLTIEGLRPDDSLRICISTDSPTLDRARAEADVIACAERLLTKNPVSALLLECTNMAPYKRALRAHTGCAVFDLVDAIHWIADARC